TKAHAFPCCSPCEAVGVRGQQELFFAAFLTKGGGPHLNEDLGVGNRLAGDRVSHFKGNLQVGAADPIEFVHGTQQKRSKGEHQERSRCNKPMPCRKKTSHGVHSDHSHENICQRPTASKALG